LSVLSVATLSVVSRAQTPVISVARH